MSLAYDQVLLVLLAYLVIQETPLSCRAFPTSTFMTVLQSHTIVPIGFLLLRTVKFLLEKDGSLGPLLWENTVKLVDGVRHHSTTNSYGFDSSVLAKSNRIQRV